MTTTNPAPPELLNLHQLAEALTTTASIQPANNPHDIDQIAYSITHHHQQSGGPLRHALAKLLTDTNSPDDFHTAVTMFATTVDLYAPPPPGQLTLF